MPFRKKEQAMKTDKFLESFSLKIPEILKHELDKLNAVQKTPMNDEIRVIIAKHVHLSKFNPEQYLYTGDDDN